MRQTPKILIVDDEESIHTAVQRLLGTHNFVFCAAFNGRQALEMILDDRPDLIILDVGMPVLNGWDTLSSIRDDPELQDIPVVMLTGMLEEGDQREGLVRGADFYLPKPFDAQILIKVVDGLLAANNDDSTT